MNPYFAYSISFLVAIGVYLLGWSNIYPTLSPVLLGFLGTSILVSVTAGFYWNRKINIKFKNLLPDRNIAFITSFIYVLWICEFIYEGGIPVIKILLKQPYDYVHFGIPSLHVFIVTFSSFYTIYLFHLFLSLREKRILWFYAINLFAAILIYNRGMLMFNVISSCCLYIHAIKTIPFRILVVAPFILATCLFLFGAVGNIRVSQIDQTSYNNSTFLTHGGASENFKNSIIPNEFFWTYIYTSSPIANLQKNINNADQHVSLTWFIKMVNNEMIFDSISKRINSIYGIPHPGEHTINGSFNVSTIYSVAYSHLGWLGMAIMFCYILIFPMVYRKLNKSNSPFYLTGFAILVTMYFFMAFDNTIRFTGLSFQLVYPLIFAWLEMRGIFILRKSPQI